MGNKHKQKALLIVLIAIVSALAIFPFVLHLKTAFSFKVNAATEYDKTGTTKGEISTTTGSLTYNIKLDSGKYMFIIAGGDGSGTSGYGYGATSFAFYSGAGLNNCSIDLNKTSYTSGNNGGGWTSTYSNLALPNGKTVGSFYAGGGGGGGRTYSSSSQHHAHFLAYGSTTYAFQGGVMRSDGTGKQGKIIIPSSWSNSEGDYYSFSVSSSTPTYSSQGVSCTRTMTWTENTGTTNYPNYESMSSTKTITGGHGGAGRTSSGTAWGGGGGISSEFISYAGGGGVGTQNGYPIYAGDSALGAKSTGRGYLKYYRIDPTTKPGTISGTATTPATIVTPTGIGSDRYTPGSASADAFSSDVLGTYIKTAWVYSTDNSTWTTDASSIKNEDLGTKKTVYYKYVIYGNSEYIELKNDKVYPCYNMKYSSATAAAEDNNYVIASGSIDLIRYGNPTYTAPTAETVVFNNTNQVLIKAGSATNGRMYYKLTKDSEVVRSWTISSSGIYAKEPGTYTVSYYVKGNTNYNNLGSTSSPYGSFTVTIGKADPQLSKGTLAPIDGLVYNGAAQTLFSGAATVGNSALDSTKRGTIYYAVVWTSGEITDATKVPKPSDSNCNVGKNGSTDISKCTGVDSVNSDTKACYRYLWYRITSTGYQKEVGWTLLTDGDGKPVTNRIQPVTLTLSGTLMSSTNYNGKAKQIITGVTKTTNSSNTTYANNFDVKYTFKRTNANDLSMSETTTNVAFTGSIASKIEVVASWTPKSSLSATAKLQYVNGTKNLGTTNIYQIDDTSKITVSGVPNLQTAGVTLKLNNNGTVQPFLNQTVAVNLKVCDVATYNGITTNNALQNIANTNKLAFGISSKDDPSTVSSWTSTSSATDLNNKIKSLTVSQSGMLYLHFKVLQHVNLKTGTMFKAAQFYVEPIGLEQQHLTGIIMGGNRVGNDQKLGQTTFDGDAHKIYTSGGLQTIDSVSVTLTGVKYAWSTSSTIEPTSNWQGRLDDLATVSDVGTYYLWVKWDSNTQISAITGMVYGSFEIKPFDAASSNIAFSGGVFDGWSNKEVTNSYINYIETYNHADRSFGQMSNPSAKIIGYDKIYSSNFGQLTFNYGTATAPINNNFVTAENFSSLKVKALGVYYIWVKWAGNSNDYGKSNIVPGQAVYRTEGKNNTTIIHDFVINKLEGDEGAEKVTLLNQNFVSAKNNGNVNYAYYFDDIGGSCATVGQAQSLFTSTTSPQVMIDGATEPYGYPTGSIKYLLSKSATGVTAGNAGWSNSVTGTKATDVGTYYLWVKIAISDSNLDIVKIIRLDKTAKIVAVESPVHNCSICKPTAKLDGNGNSIVADGEAHILINPGKQINPSLEYSLDGVKWYTDYTKITGTYAGRYIVYYRGANYGNVFYAADKDLSKYNYVQVIIESPGVKFNPYPKSLNVKYNGQPQLIFSESKASYLEQEMEVVYSWDNKNYYTYGDKALKKTNAGRYTLWVDVVDQAIQGYEGCEPRAVTVEILKADIQVSQPVLLGGNFVYKGADYQLLSSSDVDYGMIDSNKNYIKDVNGMYLSYLNRSKSGWLGGSMGKIWYIATMSKDQAPGENDNWKDSFSKVTARNVGAYYIWVKVEAGDYHNGLAATCWNPNKPIVINPLDNPDNNQYIVVDGSSYAAITGLSYTGVEQNLIKALDLKVSVIDRDNQGDVNLNKYNLVENLEELGLIYYTLIKQGDNIPEVYSEDWLLSWKSIGQVNAGTYHLCVMIKSDNFAEPVQFNLSVIIDNADEIRITPAAKSALRVSGITSVGQVYTAAGQVLATGNLIVKIGEQDITNTDIIKTKFAYGAVDTNDFSSLIWSENLNEATATEVGDYQLYVHLYDVTGNISENESLILPVFSGGLARIVRTSAVKVIYPVFAENIVFNNRYQSLILTNASLQMANGKTISGEIGAPTYYISSSPDLVDPTNTTKEGKGLKLEDVQEVDAGTYFIFVKFAQGTSHNETQQRYLGSVTIAQASDKNVALSGIEFIPNITYNGTNQELISTPVKQTLIDDEGNSLKELTVGDYSKIEYAYSTDPNNQPLTGWVENLVDLAARDAGSYYVWVKVTGGRNIDTYTKCYSADEYAKIHPATLDKGNISGVIRNDLVYTAESQSLARIDGVVKISFESNQENLNTPEYNNNLVIYWGLSEAEDFVPADWEFGIEKLKGTNAGDYHLWIMIKGSNNFSNSEGIHYCTVTIGKGSIAFSNAPGIVDGLSYNGKDQELINNGPVAKFVSGDEYFDDHKNELVVEYSLDQQNWTRDYKEIKGIDAKTYKVYYRVIASDNWNESAEGVYVEVPIKSVDASTQGLGLVEAPKVIEGIRYNEEAQDLISFGTLSTLVEGERGAAWEGSRIVFWYADAEDQKYEYYFNGEEYVWDEENGKLPGKTDVGTYTIRYYITGSINGNFCDSAEDSISVSIAKRQVWWQIAPQPVNNFRHTGEYQRIVTPGQLNVGITDPISSAKGVKIMYSTKNPAEADPEDWTETIPEVNTLGLFTVWYYVELNGNNEFNGEETSPQKAISITTLVERNMLTIVDAPRPENLNYNACPQSLVNYYYLSTDVTDAYGEKAPFIEYSFNLDEETWTSEITATDVDTYKIYYRLNYDPDLFVYEGNDGRDKNNPLSITAEITPARFTTDSIQAECKADENGKHYVTYKVGITNKYNNETGEIEEVPLYPKALMDEIDDYIVYYYRKNDVYHQEQNWEVWRNDETQFTDMANYEFKLEIIAPENQDVNFVSYEQKGTVATYLNYVYTRDIKLNIIMKDFSAPAYVRYWIDFDGSMKYDDEATAFKKEGLVSRNGTLGDTFQYVYSNGYKKGGQIKLETTNQNTYYYVSDRLLTENERRKMKLDTQDLNSANKGFNIGLLNETTTIYLYEVYHIQYDSNYGIGDSLTDGWKWHNLDYRLEENKYQKFINGDYLEPNGWNTSPSGNGNSYNGASMTYRENSSQIFYAKFFGKDEKFYTITWVIDDGVNRYTLSRDFMVWFDALNPSYENRTTGTLILEGDLITLPQVEVDEFGESLAEIFGGYVLGWHTADDETPYTIGMTAVRNMTFIAELNSELDDYVQAKFINADEQTVHESGKFASGAEAYMALSGMDGNLIKDYQEGFNQWVDKYGYDYLDRASATDGLFTYQLGTKTVPNTDTENQDLTWADYMPMFIILAVGIIPLVACLIGYLIIRNKQHKKINQAN